MSAELNQMRNFDAFGCVRVPDVRSSDVNKALDFTRVHKWKGDAIGSRLCLMVLIKILKILI